MTTQLFIYNEALGHLGERRIASLSENREPRRVLDDFWSDVVAYCLKAALWKFAKRTIQQDASTTLVPAFGFNFAFPVQNDFVRVVVASTSPNLDPPLLQYVLEAGVFYCNATPLYLAYVSNDAQYGMNIGGWPEIGRAHV